MKLNKYYIPLIVLVAALAWSTSISAEFTGYDDYELIVKNLNIQQGFWHALKFYLFQTSTSFSLAWADMPTTIYRPLEWLMSSLAYSLWGANAWCLHFFVNFLIHIINSVLVFLILKKLFTTRLANAELLAFLITLVWTVHPLHHESVNMLTSGLGFLSSTLFMLLAINLSLYSPYDSSMNPNLASLIRMLSYLCFAISFIGVEMVLIGPIVLIMILLAMNKVASRWAQMLAPLIVLANYFVIRFSISAETKYFSMSLAELAERSLVLAPQIFLHYLKLFFYPAQLGVDQHHNLVLANAFSTNHYLALAACTVLLAVIVYFFWIQDSRINLLIAGFGCFSLLGIAVTLNIYPVYCLARDRYTYFFVLGLVAVLILLAEKYFKLSTKPKTGMALIAIVVLALGTRSWYKNFDWHNGEKLWQHTIASVDDIGAKQIWRYSLIHYYEDSKTKPNRSLLEDFAYFIERNNLDQPEVYQQIMTKVKAPENYLEQKYGYADNKTIAAALYVLAERQLRFGYQDESQRTLFLSRKYYPKYFQTNMAIYLSDFYMALERQQQEQIALDLAEVAAQNRLWGRQLEEVVK